MFYLLLVLFFFLAAYFILAAVARRKGPPGPWGLPVIGNLLSLDPEAPHLSLTALARRYGPVYSLWMGSVYTVVITDYKLVRKLFVKEVFSGRAPLYVTHGIMKGFGK